MGKKYLMTENQVGKFVNFLREYNNLPPGTSDNDPSAPWNDPDYNVDNIELADDGGLNVEVSSTQFKKIYNYPEIHIYGDFLESKNLDPNKIIEDFIQTGQLPREIDTYIFNNLGDPIEDDTYLDESVKSHVKKIIKEGEI
jgi:hypothetical protein